MQGLVIIVHGSRQRATEDELQQFIQSLSIENTIIQSAYMELQQPNLTEAVKILIEKKCHKVIIFPFFILAGRHIQNDIPQQFRDTQNKFPQTEIILLKHITQLIGANKAFNQLINDNINQ